MATIGIGDTLPSLILLAIGAPLVGLLRTGCVGGVGMESFSVHWSTTMQEQLAQEKLSRLGSYVFMPIGLATAGPVAVLLGPRPTLWVLT